MRKWRFPSGKQPSRCFNSSLKGRGAAEHYPESKLAQLPLLGEAGAPGLGMQAQAPAIAFAFDPERERRRVKGTLELSLRSISKYLPSVSALGQGPVKDAQK